MLELKNKNYNRTTEFLILVRAPKNILNSKNVNQIIGYYLS